MIRRKNKNNIVIDLIKSLFTANKQQSIFNYSSPHIVVIVCLTQLRLLKSNQPVCWHTELIANIDSKNTERVNLGYNLFR